MSDLVVQNDVFTLVVQPQPSLQIVVGGGSGGGGSGTLTEIDVVGTGLDVTNATGPIVQLELDFGSSSGQVADGGVVAAHIANTSNPHSTTKSQVGLGNVTNDLQVKADGSGYTAKPTLVGTDEVPGYDSAASGALKKFTVAAIAAYAASVGSGITTVNSPTGKIAITNPTGPVVSLGVNLVKGDVGLGNVTNDAQVKADGSGYSAKTALANADTSPIYDSAASGAVKVVTELNRAAYVASIIRSPYVRPRVSPNAWDDEFDSGSADLATRGWEINNAFTGTTMTRVGDIVDPSKASTTIAVGTYRSTIIDSVLYIQCNEATPAAGSQGIFITKASTGNWKYATRIVGAVKGGPAHGVILTSRAGPASGANYYVNVGHIVFGSISTSTAGGYSWNTNTSRLINGASSAGTTAFTSSVGYGTPDVISLDVDETTTPGTSILSTAGIMSSQDQFVGTGGQTALSSISTAHVRAGANIGVVTWQNGMIGLDYIRRYPQGTWFF